MTIELLRAFYDSQPFDPSTIHLADGRDIPVLYRECIMFAPSGRTISVFQPDDTMNVVNLLLVTDLRLKFASTGPGQRAEV